MTTKTMKKNEIEAPKKDKIKVLSKEEDIKLSKTSSIIISAMILFIFTYIAFDFFVVNHQINNKVNVVNSKFDSLEVYLGNKIPQIDNAIKTQEQQVKTLQDITNSYIKK